MGSRSSWSAVVLLASACTRPLVGDGAGDSSSTGGETSSSSSASTTAPSSDASSSPPTSSTAVDTSSQSTDAASVPDVGFSGCPNDWQPPQCWASVCDEFFCGESASMFDAGGCPRVVCESDADCPASQYCNARMRAGSCFGYGPESCEFSSGQCVCGGSLGCSGDPRGFCLDRIEFPPEQACYALGIECEYLDPWFVDGYWATFEVLDAMSTDVRTQTLQCQSEYVARFIGDCATDPCFVLCQENSVSGCPHENDCDDICAAAEPSSASALALLLAADPLACFDCTSCPDGDPLCAALWDCSE